MSFIMLFAKAFVHTAETIAPNKKFGELLRMFGSYAQWQYNMTFIFVYIYTADSSCFDN